MRVLLHLDTVLSACNPRETADAFLRAGSNETRKYTYTRSVSPVYRRTMKRFARSQTLMLLEVYLDREQSERGKEQLQSQTNGK